MDSGAYRRGPLFGRAVELATLAACFDDGARLVTLVGPGGIGKTTLASAHAEARVRAGERSRAVVVDLHDASTLAELRDRPGSRETSAPP